MTLKEARAVIASRNGKMTFGDTELMQAYRVSIQYIDLVGVLLSTPLDLLVIAIEEMSIDTKEKP